MVIPAPEQCEQGSAAARRIIEAVGQRPDVFWIENHARSERVNFGQLNEGLDYEDLQSGRRCTVWQVRLDLADFAALQAPRSVRSAFEVGFIFLHELLHGLGYQDAHSWEAVGECEETINRIRGELGLPIREHYFAESFELARGFVSAKLLFKRFTPKGKARTEWLFFKPGTETYVEARGPQANDARSTQAAVRQRH